jgi:hypothetical protein
MMSKNSLNWMLPSPFSSTLAIIVATSSSVLLKDAQKADGYGRNHQLRKDPGREGREGREGRKGRKGGGGREREREREKKKKEREEGERRGREKNSETRGK